MSLGDTFDHEGLELDYGSARAGERDDDKFFRYQLDRYGDAEGGGPALEAIMPFGMFAMPRPAEVDSSGQVKPGTATSLLSFHHGSEGWAMLANDPRLVPLFPDPGEGGAGLAYAVVDGDSTDVQYMLFTGPGGGFTVRVPYAQAQKQHTIVVGGGGAALGLYHGDGPLVELGTDAVDLGGKGGAAVVVDDGLMDWLANLVTTLGAAGIQVSPPPTTCIAKKARAL
jgi:hypothetical protein